MDLGQSISDNTEIIQKDSSYTVWDSDSGSEYGSIGDQYDIMEESDYSVLDNAYMETYMDFNQALTTGTSNIEERDGKLLHSIILLY